MANQAKANPAGGPVSWSIIISHLKVAVYRALLMDSTNTVVQKWEDQRTDDSIPDTFELTQPVAKLAGCYLWWQAVVMDPSDAGGPYVGSVTVTQDGNMLCSESAPGTIPPGKGMADLYADQVQFI
ncbi:MAG: hypothetical protein ABIR47_01265 [Candidatus Kapaibacterium sp.]